MAVEILSLFNRGYTMQWC